MNSFLFCVTARSLESFQSYSLHYHSGVLQWHSGFLVRPRILVNILKFDTLSSFLRLSKRRLAQGPIALIFVEDDIEIRSTIAHHLMRGFRSILVFVPKGIAHPDGFAPEVHSIRYDTHDEEAVTCAIDRIILWAPDTWMYYCYNAEYLFYPFCETRSISELLAFNTQEERAAMLTYTIDLYAADLSQNPNAVCTQTSQIDSSGYYAQTRVDPDNHKLSQRATAGFFWRASLAV